MDPATMDECNQNDLSYVNKRLEDLDVIRKTIEDLESKLLLARASCIQVQKELDAHHASKAPIRRLPQEVLLMIFNNWDNDQAKRNGTLIFVCKLWNTLVMEAPTMWTKIDIVCSKPWDMPQCWGYAQACVDHSVDAPLEISLRFMWHNDQTLTDFWRGIIQSAQDNVNDSIRMARKFGSLSAQSVEEGIYSDVHCEILPILKGRQGQHMRRWHKLALKIVCWEEEDETNIWDMIAGPTPNLHDLKIASDSGAFSSIGLTQIFPELHALREFQTNLALDMTAVAFNPPLLQGLYLQDPNTSYGFLKHASFLFRRLVRLELRFWPRCSFDEIVAPVRFPNLRELILYVPLGEGVLKLLDTPSLVDLDLTSDANHPYSIAPVFKSVINFNWKIRDVYRREVSAIRSILEQMPSLVHLRIQLHSPESESGVRALLSDLRVDNNCLARLRRVDYVQVVDRAQYNGKEEALPLGQSAFGWNEFQIKNSDW